MQTGLRGRETRAHREVGRVFTALFLSLFPQPLSGRENSSEPKGEHSYNLCESLWGTQAASWEGAGLKYQQLGSEDLQGSVVAEEGPGG